MKITISHCRPLGALSLLLILLLAAGCGKNDGDAQDEGWRRVETAGSQTESPPAPAGSVSLAGIRFTPPADWKDLGPSGMRQAQYQLAPVEGDGEPAELNVFYFGADQGGSIEANLQRWIGQMSLPDGGDPSAAASRGEMEAGGMKAHLLTLDGTYNASMGGPMSGGSVAKEGYRLVGVVLEGPQGSVFFKLTGPVATAQAMQQGLMEMVRQVQKGV